MFTGERSDAYNDRASSMSILAKSAKIIQWRCLVALDKLFREIPERIPRWYIFQARHSNRQRCLAGFHDRSVGQMPWHENSRSIWKFVRYGRHDTGRHKFESVAKEGDPWFERRRIFRDSLTCCGSKIPPKARQNGNRYRSKFYTSAYHWKGYNAFLRKRWDTSGFVWIFSIIFVLTSMIGQVPMKL